MKVLEYNGSFFSFDTSKRLPTQAVRSNHNITVTVYNQKTNLTNALITRFSFPQQFQHLSFSTT